MFKPKPVFYILPMGVLIWTNIWFNGLFSTIMWLIIVSSMVGIFLKITDRI
jgi:hypothetical protein